MTVELLAGELQTRESKKAVTACNDYLRLGPGRSLAKLCRTYAEPGPIRPPTRHLATLKRWSADYNWQQRAALYDAEIEQQKSDYTQSIMKSGLALPHERVTELKALAWFLRQEIFIINDNGEIEGLNRDKVWLPDVKQIGGGEFAERVDLVRFNSSLFERFQAILDDLAKETGGRRQRRENLNFDFSKLTDDQLDRIAAGEDPLDVILATSGGGA
ncbi:MAG: hypothetical protein KDJ52_00230 [Anaerolineae bacterium]|nr:hypothetical protein [Anaerolineae bacterium]